MTIIASMASTTVNALELQGGDQAIVASSSDDNGIDAVLNGWIDYNSSIKQGGLVFNKYKSPDSKGKKYVILSHIDEDKKLQDTLDIPRDITDGNENYIVIAIEDEAFKGNTSIKHVNIDANIKSFGKSIFENCTSLESVNMDNDMSNNIEKLGEDMFKGCN